MTTLTIRRSTDADRRALHRLALLDSGYYDGQPMLMAEQDGELVAAVPAEQGGRAFADPFVPTAPVVDVLSMRAAQLRSEAASAPRSIVRRTSHALAAAIATR